MGTLTIGIIFLYRYLKGFGEYEGYYYFMYLLISMSASMILLCLYILSSYIGRTYLEVKGRPSYLINEFIDNRDEQA